MSLIIKGSIMPLMCGDCPCYDGSDYACNATGRGVIEYRYDGRPGNCPLVELPTSHGRLIDADELIGYLNEWLSDSVALFGFTRIINHQPTIVEAEVPDNA